VTRLNWLTLVAGVGLAALSLYFSATGLVSLFAGAGVSIVVLAIVFEVAKVATAAWLSVNLRLRVLPVLLSIGVLALSGVSSLGVYAYLGAAYAKGRETAVASSVTTASLLDEIRTLEGQRSALMREIAVVPTNQGRNRSRILAQLTPRLATLDSLILDRRAQQRTAATRAAVAGIGELKYAADLLGVTEDRLARGIMTTLAFLLDPLAVLLLFASGVKRSVTGAVVEHLPDVVELASVGRIDGTEPQTSQGPTRSADAMTRRSLQGGAKLHPLRRR